MSIVKQINLLLEHYPAASEDEAVRRIATATLEFLNGVIDPDLIRTDSSPEIYVGDEWVDLYELAIAIMNSERQTAQNSLLISGVLHGAVKEIESLRAQIRETPIAIDTRPACCVCGTIENVVSDGWYGYRCDSDKCMCF